MFAETYAKYYDLLNSDKPYKKEIKFVYKWAEKPKSILDVGVGTASYWKHYPEKVILTGIEKSVDMFLQANDERIYLGDITHYIHHPYSFDCITALFDVINYIPTHDWWKRLPLKKGGYFIFDIWDKEKVNKDGFRTTTKYRGGITRTIEPLIANETQVKLNILLTLA